MLDVILYLWTKGF